MARKFNRDGQLVLPSQEHYWAIWFVERLQRATWIQGGLQRPKPYGRSLAAIAVLYGLSISQDASILTAEVMQWLRSTVHDAVHPGNRRLPRSAARVQPKIADMFSCVFDDVSRDPHALRRSAKRILGCAAVDEIDRICSRLSFHVMANQVGRSLLRRDGGF